MPFFMEIMFLIRYAISSINILYADSLTHTQKVYIRAYGGKFLKSILTYLYCNNYNEINIDHSNIQKDLSYIGPHEQFLLHFKICLETARKVFSIMFHGFFLHFDEL